MVAFPMPRSELAVIWTGDPIIANSIRVASSSQCSYIFESLTDISEIIHWEGF